MCLHNSRPSFSTVTSAFRVANASTPVLCTICNKMCVPSTDGHDDATKTGNYVTQRSKEATLQKMQNMTTSTWTPQDNTFRDFITNPIGRNEIMCLHHDCLYYRYRDTARRVVKKRKAPSATRYLLRTDNVVPDTHRRQHDRYVTTRGQLEHLIEHLGALNGIVFDMCGSTKDVIWQHYSSQQNCACLTNDIEKKVNMQLMPHATLNISVTLLSVWHLLYTLRSSKQIPTWIHQPTSLSMLGKRRAATRW